MAENDAFGTLENATDKLFAAFGESKRALEGLRDKVLKIPLDGRKVAIKAELLSDKTRDVLKLYLEGLIGMAKEMRKAVKFEECKH